MATLCFNAFNHSAYLGAATPLRAQIDAAAGAGFALIGLDAFSLAGPDPAEVARWLSAAGIGCGAITCAGMLGSDPQATASVARAANLARALGAPFVQVNMGAGGAAQRPALEAACDAAGAGVRLAIEYLPFTPLDRVADTLALAQAVGLERAGVLIDVWHHERGPDGWDDLAAVPAAAIAYVEFDDAVAPLGDAAEDTLERRVMPGEGLLDLPRFAATIAATGYRGMVSVEVLSAEWRARDVAGFARAAYAASAPYWSGLSAALA